MPDETPVTRIPALPDELRAFNESRRVVLQNRPIDPEGMAELGRLLSDGEAPHGP